WFSRSPTASPFLSMAGSSRPEIRKRSATTRRSGVLISASRNGRTAEAGMVETGAAGGQAAPLLKVDGIETCYGLSQVLFGVSLAIMPGEVATLMGRNGMGKTTTVRSIMGLTPARAGAIVFDGADIR